MVNLIVNEIVTALTNNLAFVDKITGIVKPATVTTSTGEVKTFPVALNLDVSQCNESELLDYVPDSTKTSIIYFEDRGVTFRECKAQAIEFTANFLLVCWFNYKLINPTLTNTSQIVANIIKYLPLGNMGTITPLMNVWLEVGGQEPNDGGVFSRYSYKEEISQYITYPYDYVALSLRADYRVRLDCIDDIELDPAECL